MLKKINKNFFKKKFSIKGNYNGICCNFFLFPLPLKALLLVLAALMLAGRFSVSTPASRDGWQPLSWLDRGSVGPVQGHEELKLKMEDILEVFKNAGTLNPPVGVAISPRGDLFPPLSLPEDSEGPAVANLRLSMRFPYVSSDVTAGVRVRINDPYSLLGEPVLNDSKGGIYILPPLIEERGGQQLYCRSAHPVGYDQKFPSYSFFPLWGSEVEPFLRSVVRPTFGLAQPTVATIFTTGGHPFWEPVSRQRWILALKEKARGELENFLAGVNAARETEYTREQIEKMRSDFEKIQKVFDEEAIIARHQKTLEDAEKMFEMMKGFDPEEAEKRHREILESADENLEAQLEAAAELRPEFEEHQRNLIEALLTIDDIWNQADAAISGRNWDNLEKLGEELEVPHFLFLSDTGRKLEMLQAELNAMSASERRSPAYGFELPPWHPLGPHRHIVALDFHAERASGLVDPGTEGARSLLSINPAFFDSFTSPSSILLLSVEWWEETDARYRSEGGMFYNERRVNMLDDLWSSLNWNAISSFVD